MIHSLACEKGVIVVQGVLGFIISIFRQLSLIQRAGRFLRIA